MYNGAVSAGGGKGLKILVGRSFPHHFKKNHLIVRRLLFYGVQYRVQKAFGFI